MPTELTLLDLREALEVLADPRRAPQQQAYLKSSMPCLGVSVPDVRQVTRELFRGEVFATLSELERFVLQVWRGAEFREERALALELLELPQVQRLLSVAALPLYEELIVTGAWWDLVDGLAIHQVGALFDDDARAVKRALSRWSRGENVWLRRAAMLSQLQRRDRIDVEFLFDCLAPSLGSKEVFLQKAIGWALRELAKTQPLVVKRYLAEHRELAALSRGEAERGLLMARPGRASRVRRPTQTGRRRR